MFQVSLEEMYNGATKELALQSTVICKDCEGHGGPEGAVQWCSPCRGSGIQVGSDGRVQYNNVLSGLYCTSIFVRAI